MPRASKQHVGRSTQRVRHLPWVAWVLSVLTACAGNVPLAVAPTLEREDRIVVFSPHFDRPPLEAIGLNCGAAPLHLVGFEGSANEDPTSGLMVRTVFHPISNTDVFPQVLPGVMLRLVRGVDSAAADSLPFRQPYVVITDSAGLGTLAVPRGTYHIRFQTIGFGTEEGIVRIRGSANDSLRAYMAPRPICQEAGLHERS
jgi:hypothetical protein